MRVADPSLLSFPANATASSPAWRALGLSMLGLACIALTLRFTALEQIIAFVARSWSGDGEISAGNRRMLGLLLIEAAMWCAAFGLLAFAMSQPGWRARARAWFLTDRLEKAPGSVPDPLRMLMLSTACGIAIISLWVLQLRTAASFEWLYRKEGPLELLSYLLLMAAAGWCGLAARHRYRRPGEKLIAASQAALAILLFVVAMEEISWGQTYLAWETPQSWASINSQQETTLHNLMDQKQLHETAQLLTFVFVVAALLAVCVGGTSRRPFLQALAPHASMVPVLLLVGYAAAKYHLEISEILFSIFIACYSWRLYRAAKGASRVSATV